MVDASGPDVISLEELLRFHGPHANGGEPPTDAAIFERLEGFGRAYWQVESRTQREYAAQLWAEWLKTQLLPNLKQSWRVVREAIVAGQRTLVRTEGWRWYSEEELSELPPPMDLIDGYIPEAGLVELFGPSGHMKTFTGLDFGLSVAAGIPWHGATVCQGGVAYIAPEGRRGIRSRVQAWRKARDWGGPLDIQFLLQPVRFLEPSRSWSAKSPPGIQPQGSSSSTPSPGASLPMATRTIRGTCRRMSASVGRSETGLVQRS